MNKEKGLIIPIEDVLGMIKKYIGKCNIPEGSWISDVHYDYRRKSFIAILHNESFPERLDGYELELMVLEKEE